MKSTVNHLAQRVVGLLPGPARTALHRAAGASLAPTARRIHEDTATLIDMGLSFQIWRDRGFNPAFVVDAGAHKGDFAALAHRVWPGARIAMVEPRATPESGPAEVLKRLGNGSSLHPVLLGAEPAEAVQFVEMGSGSSVLNEMSGEDRRVTTRPLTTLNALAKEHGWPAVDLLKIDVQGYELAVLKGATDLLPSVGVIVAECSVVVMNEGAPHVSEVIAFLDGRGFDFVDVMGLIRRPGDRATIQIDAVFVRRDGPAMPKPGFF